MWASYGLNRYFPDGADLKRNVIHVLVEAPQSSDAPPAKRRRLDDATAMAAVWRLSKWKFPLPLASELCEVLEKPLPFRLPLHYHDEAREAFQPEANLLDCPLLKMMIDNFVHLCDPQVLATVLWQSVYAVLLGIPRFRLLAKVYQLKNNEKTTTLKELHSKIPSWDSQCYGDLPYVIGYAFAGAHLVAIAIEKSGDSIHTTELLKIDITENPLQLAFLQHEMLCVTRVSTC